jgi:hypothetical protein
MGLQGGFYDVKTAVKQESTPSKICSQGTDIRLPSSGGGGLISSGAVVCTVVVKIITLLIFYIKNKTLLFKCLQMLLSIIK